MKTGTCILAFIGGALAGAAAALLMSPKCGAELRGKIRDMVGSEMDSLRYHGKEIKDVMKDSLD